MEVLSFIRTDGDIDLEFLITYFSDSFECILEKDNKVSFISGIGEVGDFKMGVEDNHLIISCHKADKQYFIRLLSKFNYLFVGE